ncbi:hypothetical protein [Rhizobium sp. CECT 9324]|uniref:hypothetical protein n=1 Tax=Rhizobium sp. CECT 9324 TaxID=2845820 RepID=UPI001E39BE76|nr:hypothetical protein [Rhizobium sp. CECT 9324]
MGIIGEATSELIARLEDGNLFDISQPTLDQKLGNDGAGISAADDRDAGGGACGSRLQSR